MLRRRAIDQVPRSVGAKWLIKTQLSVVPTRSPQCGICCQKSRPVRSHEGHPAHIDGLRPHADSLRPNADVIEALPPIAGDRHGVLRRYSEVDAGDVMSLAREY